MSEETKAEEMFEKANNKIKGFSLFGNSSKWQDASDMYTKAANLFRINKKWDSAGDAHSKAAECHLKLHSKYEAATSYTSAANCYRRSNFTNATVCLKQAIEFYIDEGRFSIAAKHQRELAELYESKSDVDNAITSYELASSYYEGDNSANHCMLKVASLSVQLERYDKAIELYEQVASVYIDNNLLKWNVKECLLWAGLCHVAKGDVVSAERALESYQDMDASFSSQRECKFLYDVVNVCRNYDVEAFSIVVAEYDAISKLDARKVAILLKIKKTIEENQLR